jgi:hypothetical protein
VFDYRYHAISLAAVLLALALGVVIGVAIGDSSLVSSAKSGIVHELSSEVSGVQHQAGQLRAQLTSEEAFANDLYPLAVHELLAGRTIGMVFLGSSSNRVDALVRGAVTQAGGNLVTVVAVREPLDLTAIAHEAAGTRYAALDASPTSASEGASSTTTGTQATGKSGESTGKSGEGGGQEGASPAAESTGQLVERFGALVGRQLVSGGPGVDKELISRARAGLMSAFDGQLGKLEGLVVERADPTGMSTEQAQASAEFESGLIAGAAAVGVTPVGVELSTTEPSQIPWYQSKSISSVDDLDTPAGQAALIYALAGSHGTFGTKSTANALLPSTVGTSTSP